MKGLITFEDALHLVRGSKPPHLLLGNGFSRACRDNIFDYQALFQRANFQALSTNVSSAFQALSTTDFEVVMRAMRQAADLAQAYQTTDADLADRLRRDADGLREVLVSAIADSHPEWPGEVDASSYASCKRFLNNFHRIYSLNYDLLLYWALMQTEIEPHVPCDDGFRKPDDPDADYVTWEPENTYNQNVYYLHGALHVFDSGSEIQKYTWINTGVRLIEQIRSALATNLYPLFVAESDSRKKLVRIRHSDFLSKAHRSVVSLTGSMFIFGWSMDDSDTHIAKLLAKSKIEQLFVGIRGDPTRSSAQRLMDRARAIEGQRLSKKPLSVSFYDASSAQVWA